MRKQNYNITSALHDANLTNQIILVRADLNVPMNKGKITNDYKLNRIIPTLELILKNHGKIILTTHCGRPQNCDPNLSTKNLLSWFKKKGYQIEFAENLETAKKKRASFSQILLLENLRFFPGELSGQKEFAKKLAALGDYYVNDAFGALHRTDISICLVPTFFSNSKRTIGLLIEQELIHLNKLLQKKKSPYVVLLGGAKIKTKLPLIKNFLEHADIILLCPAVVFTFLKVLGKSVGKSLVDNTLIDTCSKILNIAKEKNTQILFPVDYQISDSFDGIPTISNSNEIPQNAVGISIGPKTVSLFADEIKKAQTIFYNGVFGNEKNKDTLQSMKSILTAMKESNAFTIIGGGDTVAVAQKLGFDNSFDFYSTGGGATLAYLAGKKLPGLDVLIQNT
ncbi:phosphoglycerate kinase [bacterium]|nr:phosphoglycerate kinase [bacterium]